jgi:hypothetical protein
LGALRLVLWYWPGSIALDVSSGVFSTLASDFAGGTLYRPLLGPLGYGGTRYMPIFFVAQGLLLRLGVDPVVAGASLTALSALLLDAALFALMRGLGLRTGLALPFALLGHATASVQLLTLETKCDLLAAALNLGGVALALRYARRPARWTWAAALLASSAAVFTKLNSVSGMLASVALLRVRRGASASLAFAAGLGALLATGLLAFQTASDGRMGQSLRAVGSGGISFSYAVRFPVWFLLALAQDPFSLVIVAAAAYYAIRETRHGRRGFAVGYFWLVLALTVPVFASPGTDNNHLIDLLAASLLLLGWVCQRAPDRAALARFVPATLAGLTLLSFVPGVISIRSVVEHAGRPRRSTIEAIASRAGAPDRILSENPIVPLLAGGRAVVSDPFSLRLLAARFPELRSDFAKRLSQGDFPCVVLVDWSRAEGGGVLAALQSRSDRGVDHFYGDVRFPAGFLDVLERDYTVSLVEHPFVVFERRRGAAE